MKGIRLFLSSPGDVDAERGLVHDVAGRVNRMLGNELDFAIEVVDWKTHVAGDMGRPQEVINRQIGHYDIFVGIMWKRFGTPTDVAESGTEEEFNLAYANWQRFSTPRILFYFKKEPYSPGTSLEASQWVKVLAFKEGFQHKHPGLVREYLSTEEFSNLLLENLAKAVRELLTPPGKPGWKPPPGDVPKPADFTRYLRDLSLETMYIDIKGLGVGQGRAQRFRIDELYIPLQTTGALSSEEAAGGGRRHPAKKGEHEVLREMPREVPLEEALKEQKLVIKGDPGAGKTTFLRLISFLLCRSRLGEESSLGIVRLLWPESPPIPILVRLGRLTEHIRECKDRQESGVPVSEDSPDWLLHFLDSQGRELNWGVGEDDFRQELKSGRCLIMLDGLDEAHDARTRSKIGSLAGNLLRAYGDCRVVLTSRPAALAEGAAPTDFRTVEIAPLDDESMEAFLSRWCGILYAEAPEKARAYRKELGEALRARVEIRRMARTPVMLTALATVHWNEQCLPEQRANLYESILTWLCRSREQRPGRMKADRCRKLLQKLALSMFTDEEGRLKQIPVRRAAEKLAREFDPTRENTALELAEIFLREEMVDSGISVERGKRLEFWHLSFQEYLAACEIAGMVEEKQRAILFEKERLYSSEWREVMLLLAGVLYEQGEEKVNLLIGSILDRLPERKTKGSLPTLAKAVGLVGGMVHDLSPFNFKPANPVYPEIVKRVMGIFEKETYKSVPVNIRVEAADTLGRVGDPRLLGDPMVKIPGGCFWMGAQKSNRKDRNYDEKALKHESPVHQVELSPFSISKYPVTVGQYKRFIDDGGYENERHWKAGGFGKYKEPEKWEEQLQYPSRPVVYVSWYEAAAYATWAGGRLPTEAEWERAARGPGEEYRKYPWGNDDPTSDRANFRESYVGHVTPGGVFPEDCSPEGVIDMAGNVWEWCLDGYGEYYYEWLRDKGVVKDPPGLDRSIYHVERGGMFYDFNERLRSASRLWGSADDRVNYVGFRVVRGPFQNENQPRRGMI